MKKLGLAFFSLLANNLSAQFFEFSWAQAIKGNGIANCQNIVTDADDNVYAIGTFNETQDFSGEGTTILATEGNHNFYLIKRNSNGDFLWAVAFEDTPGTYVTASDIAIDNSGTILVAGTFYGELDFDPSADVNTISSAGTTKAYLCKFDLEGNYVDAKTFGGTVYISLTDIEIDEDNNVYCVGTSESPITDFDPGDLVSNTESLGSADAYLTKLDNQLNLIWVKLFGGAGVEFGNRVCIDPNNDVLMNGEFYNTGDYNPNEGEFIFTPIANNNSVVVKLTSNGEFLWAKAFMPPSNSGSFSSNGIDANDDGIYLSGTVSGTIDFDPNIGAQNYTQTGSVGIDGFVLKLTLDGDFQYVKTIANGIGGLLKVNSTTVCATGQIMGASDIDPNARVNFISNNGGQQGYLIVLDNEGETLSSNVPPVSVRSDAMAVCFDSENAVYVCGSFLGNGDLEFSFGDSVITHDWADTLTTYDPYLYKLDDFTTISINDQTEKKEVKMNIYPNPAINILNVEAQEQIVSIKVSNSIGQFFMDSNPSSISTFLDLSKFSNGIYTIRVDLKDGTKWYKNFSVDK